mmetsp:Transcript_44893/g.106534  ORF Transcript_44893/g.106534 Transcript_44893/m.106534 type:complete len:209 (-) Transcript_44893:863-1489(-)
MSSGSRSCKGRNPGRRAPPEEKRSPLLVDSPVTLANQRHSLVSASDSRSHLLDLLASSHSICLATHQLPVQHCFAAGAPRPPPCAHLAPAPQDVSLHHPWLQLHLEHRFGGPPPPRLHLLGLHCPHPSPSSRQGYLRARVPPRHLPKDAAGSRLHAGPQRTHRHQIPHLRCCCSSLGSAPCFSAPSLLAVDFVVGCHPHTRTGPKTDP